MLFAEPAEDMRLAVADIPYFIATTETAKHRVFVRISSRYLADQKVRVIATKQLCGPINRDIKSTCFLFYFDWGAARHWQ